MLTRYSHPRVTELWEDEWTYGEWLEIERCVLRAQREANPDIDAQTVGLWRWLQVVHINDEAAGAIRAIERTETRHDVAAFLAWLRRDAPEGQWLHFGLTSSDLVDTTQGLRFKELYGVLLDGIGDLVGQLSRWTDTDIPLVGRTHGQPAEPTSMRARAWHWLSTMEPALLGLQYATRMMQYAKLSGPVGTYAHNPPEIEAQVAGLLGLLPMGQGASQIVPRSSLAMWANAASVFAVSCAKIATDLRLMNLLGQASWPHSEGQIGSSAMPHKNNPIVAEQICGMAQLARGYASMLQPLDLWLERDISHSCVERVAVPDLWHVLLHTIKQTTWLLGRLEICEPFNEMDLQNNANALWSHRATLDAIRDGETYENARGLGRSVDVDSYDIGGDAEWWMRNYLGKRAGA